jgi:hypothetical protein
VLGNDCAICSSAKVLNVCAGPACKEEPSAVGRNTEVDVGMFAAVLGGGLHRQQSTAQLLAEQQKIVESLQPEKQQLQEDHCLTQHSQQAFSESGFAQPQRQKQSSQLDMHLQSLGEQQSQQQQQWHQQQRQEQQRSMEQQQQQHICTSGQPNR